MNLYAASKTLGTLTDKQLASMLTSPHPALPRDYIQYEVDRRKSARLQGMVKPVDTTPVMQSPQSLGIPSTPQMSEGGAGYVDGGIVGYAGGGQVDYYQDPMGVDMSPYMGDGEDAFAAEKAALQRELERAKLETGRVAARMQLGAGRVRDVMFPGGMAADQRNAQYDDTMKQLGEPVPSSVYPEQRRLTSPIPQPPPPQPDARAGIAGVLQAVAAKMPSSAGGRSGGVSPAMGGPSMGTPLTGRSPLDIPDIPSQPDKPDLSDSPEKFERYMEMVGKYNPDQLSPLLSKVDERLANGDKYRSDAKNQALLAAGLGILAGRSPHAMQNIGEGGLKGLAMYQNSMHNVRDQEDRLQSERDRILVAKQAAANGNFKTAAELVEKENTRSAQMYGYDSANYGRELSDRRHMIAEQARMEQQDRIASNAERRLGLEERRVSAYESGIAKRGAGGGGGREDRSEERARKEAVSVYNRLKAEYMRNNKPDAFSTTNPAQLQASAHQFAMENMSDDLREALSGAIKTQAAPVAAAAAPAGREFTLGPGGKWK